MIFLHIGLDDPTPDFEGEEIDRLIEEKQARDEARWLDEEKAYERRSDV